MLERLRRRIGGFGAGSAASIWTVSSAGQRLRNLHAGSGAVTRVREPGERFVAHYLAIADARLALVRAERAGRLDSLSVELESVCWRPYTGLGGSREVLKPDMAAVTSVGDYEDHWFIEIDCGTESLPTLLRQCERYAAYRRSGVAQAALGVFPRVVWVVPTGLRADKLHAGLDSTRRLDRDLFRITTPDGFADLICGGAA